LLARHHLLCAVARHHAVRHLGARIRLLGHDLGRTVVGLDDRDLAGAGRADIAVVAVGRCHPKHAERQNCGNLERQAPALLGLVQFLVILALIGVRVVRIGRIALEVLCAVLDLAIERIVIARRIGFLFGLHISLWIVLISLLVIGLVLMGRLLVVIIVRL